MRIYASQFSRALSDTLCPYYLLFGKEPTHIQLNAELLIEHLVQKGFERTFHLVENASQFDWSTLPMALASPSLFEPCRLIDIYVPQFKINKAIQAVLLECTQLSNPNTIWMLRTHEVESVVQKQAWWKACEAQGLVVHHPQLNEQTCLNWLTQYAHQRELKLTQRALCYLRDQYHGNLIRAKQALDLIALMPPETLLDAEQLAQQFKQEGQYSTFELCDYALAGQSSQVQSSFQALNAPAHLPLIIWNLQKCLTELQTLMTNPAVFEKLSIWANRKPHYYAAKNRLSPAIVTDLVHLLFKADMHLKSGKTQLSGEIIENVLLHVSGFQPVDYKVFF